MNDVNETDISELPKFVKDKLVGLSSKQIQACFALSNPDDERSQSEIGASLGLGYGTISMWKARNHNRFNDAILTMSLYHAAQLVPIAVKSWKKLLESGKWQAVEKIIDYGLAYDQMLTAYESSRNPTDEGEKLI